MNDDGLGGDDDTDEESELSDEIWNENSLDEEFGDEDLGDEDYDGDEDHDIMDVDFVKAENMDNDIYSWYQANFFRFQYWIYYFSQLRSDFCRIWYYHLIDWYYANLIESESMNGLGFSGDSSLEVIDWFGNESSSI